MNGRAINRSAIPPDSRGEGRAKPGECARGAVCPAGGAAWLRLEPGRGVKGGGEPGREPPYPRTYPLPTSRPHPRVSTSSPLHGLLCCPLRSPRDLPDPYPFKRYLQPHRPSRQEAGISALAPARLGLGTGWAMQAGTWAFLGEGVGVSSLPHSGRRAWGGGWAGAEASGSRVCRGAAEWNRWLGRGEGTWRQEEGCGGWRMRNQEFRRPESPRRSPPPHLFPEGRGVGSASLFLREPCLASGLRQTPLRSRPPGGAPLTP